MDVRRTVDDRLLAHAKWMVVGTAVEANGFGAAAVVFLGAVGIHMAGLTATEAWLARRAQIEAFVIDHKQQG